MISQIKIRRGTTAEWAAAHPVVLANGEPGYDTTLKLLKIGDGVTNWASLPFQKSDNSDKLDGNTLSQLKLLMYPIGAIYESTVSTSPATLFGGTWSAIGGRFLIGADGVYAAGSTGGESMHTLSISEIPHHKHDGIDVDNLGQTLASGYLGNPTTGYGGGFGINNGNPNYLYSTSFTGGGGAHNNMPPWYAVYMWRRTA